MSLKPLICHLPPDDSHSLSGSHLKVYHAARSWKVKAAFDIMAQSTVMSTAVLLLRRWRIGGRKVRTRIWVSLPCIHDRNQLMIFLSVVAGVRTKPRY